MTDVIPELLQVEVPLGARVMIFADLHLNAASTPASAQASDELVRAIEAWHGPGVLVCNGGLFDGACNVDDVLAAHPRLAACLATFAAAPGRRLVVLPGFRDPELAWSPQLRATLGARLGAEVALRAELEVATAAGISLVQVDPGARYDALAARHDPTNPGEVPLATHLRNQAAARVGAGRAGVKKDRWLVGLDELDDPGAAPRFIASRLAYRKLAQRSWLLLLLVVPALAFRVPLALIHRAGDGLSDASRLELGFGLTVIELLVLVVLAGVALRQTWTALAGFTPSQDSPDRNGSPRDAARDLVSTGYRGLITSHTGRAELTVLADGFYCNTGGMAATVSEAPSRLRALGLPAVFMAARQIGWVELEAGHELHARLIYGAQALPGATWLERVAAGGDAAAVSRGKSLHLDVVAVFPHGESWPPPVTSGRRRAWIRRLAALFVGAAGFLSLISALSEPFRDRLNVIRDVVPLAVPEVATALTALGALALLLLARGIRRGQRRAWAVCQVLLLTIAVLHLVKGVNVEETVVALAVAAFLWVNRASFAAASDLPPVRRGLLTVVGSGLVAVVAGTLGLELGSWYSIQRHRRVEHRLSWVRAFQATAERMVGVDHVRLPTRLAEFFDPATAAVGVGLGLALAWLLLRPVVSRRATGAQGASTSGASDPAGMARARAILARHASGTLDYFALRSDKEFFFWGDTVVAYAVYNGTCLVSPDPVGPPTEAEEAWRRFRAFVDTRGWALGVLGAGEEWLPIYRSTGMHDLYVGDEGVVRIERFTLDGGRFKGLRQAVNRVAKHGYTITFHDPADLEPTLRAQLEEVMTKSRRGDVERGFSMTLGRVFQPEDQGLLLAVVHGPPDAPDGPPGPPVAFCQYVPAPGIGGYSLDLMRRDNNEHPNGLIDFAVVETIRYLKAQGKAGLGLNFATMRAVLAGEAGEGMSAKVQAWMLRRMGDSMQIESLWKFNAKFDPDWQPRYAIYDAPENALSTAIAVARAESFWELPVIGRFLVPSADRAGTPECADGAPREALFPALPER